ncbi:Lipolytic enzyme, G-D-S-L [Sulfitobacter noctilucicola]|uniref:Lysophospholipase L1-like esterase n=1 Tax=Sulfitobacter noctilucicola TaxID=1342301 RepID=A0A7W6Q567_9RHOB|nr:SGNH/GDSL hydrolase family protein [Sulfitobacter noctilucicola]KIN61967.1 Lipolytic enzyme, G-D-S-L [Sulfitobacter noctilucicola]MBB4173512.1 lysophospholipase L1-like esterase [Sulfitobacter noctilucicola]
MIDTAVRFVLSPLLIAQAVRVRRTAQSLPEAAGPRTGTIGGGQPLRLAIIGDSSAAGVGVSTQSEALSGQLIEALSETFSVTWHLDALTGATTKSTLDRLKDAHPEPVDVIVVALGVNDVTRLVPASLWVSQQQALLGRLEELYQPAQIYLSGMPPLGHFPLLPHPLRWTLGRHADRLQRRLLKVLFARADCTYVPFDQPLVPALMASDGFHPGPVVYTLWAKEMASRIISDWPELSAEKL